MCGDNRNCGTWSYRFGDGEDTPTVWNQDTVLHLKSCKSRCSTYTSSGRICWHRQYYYYYYWIHCYLKSKWFCNHLLFIYAKRSHDMQILALSLPKITLKRTMWLESMLGPLLHLEPLKWEMPCLNYVQTIPGTFPAHSILAVFNGTPMPGSGYYVMLRKLFTLFWLKVKYYFTIGTYKWIVFTGWMYSLSPSILMQRIIVYPIYRYMTF